MKTIIFFFCVAGFIFAQTISIGKFDKSGYFIDFKGNKIALAGISFFPPEHPDTNIQKFSGAIADTLNNILIKYRTKKIYESRLNGIEQIHLIADSININLKLLLNGYAIAMKDYRGKFCDLYIKAEEYARYYHNGIWGIKKNTVKIFKENELLGEEPDKILHNFFINYYRTTEASIVRVFDNNLFLTDNDEVIKLYNLDIPSIYSENMEVQDYAKTIYPQIKSLLNKLTIQIQRISTTNLYNYAVITKKTLFREYDYIAIILKKGWARIKDTTDLEFYKKYYPYIKIAREDKTGIWKYDFANNKNLLDSYYSHEQILDIQAIKLREFENNKEAYKFNIGRFTGSTMIGLLGATAGFFGGAFIGAGIELSNPNNRGFLAGLGGGMIGATIGTLTLSSLAMYWHAQSYNKDVSYWGILGMNFAGILTAGGYVFVCEKIKQNNPLSYLAILIPTAIGSLYSNTINPPEFEKNPELEYMSSKNNIPFSDRQVNCELVRINF